MEEEPFVEDMLALAEESFEEVVSGFWRLARGEAGREGGSWEMGFALVVVVVFWSAGGGVDSFVMILKEEEDLGR